jgi:hypothetical protein
VFWPHDRAAPAPRISVMRAVREPGHARTRTDPDPSALGEGHGLQRNPFFHWGPRAAIVAASANNKKKRK